MNRIASLSNESKLNLAGLVVAAMGMVLEIASGSKLYPTLTGPIVLLVGGALIALRPGRWTSYLGLGIPLVLGTGLAVSAVLTPDFFAQLADFGNAGIAVGSAMHVVGLTAAIAGGVTSLRRPQGRQSGATDEVH